MPRPDDRRTVSMALEDPRRPGWANFSVRRPTASGPLRLQPLEPWARGLQHANGERALALAPTDEPHRDFSSKEKITRYICDQCLERSKKRPISIVDRVMKADDRGVSVRLLVDDPYCKASGSNVERLCSTICAVV